MNRRRATAAGVCLIISAVGLTSIARADATRDLARYYGGATSEGTPFALELARGKALAGAAILVSGECDDHRRMGYYGRLTFEPALPASVRVGEHVFRSRRLSRSGRFSAAGIGADWFGDAVGQMRETIAGRIRRDGGAEGRYRSIVTMVAPNGSILARCDTGVVEWRATGDRGGIYTGRRSGAFAFVLEFEARRTEF